MFFEGEIIGAVEGNAVIYVYTAVMGRYVVSELV